MRTSGRRFDALFRFRRRGGMVFLASALLAMAMMVMPALAREVIVRGSTMSGFGRILLEFDQPTKIQARLTNGILVVGFANPARIRSEKLANELAPYVSTVRRDPDDTGLRLALVGPFRPNVLEAGERVYIDLLPPNWVGLPPSLPDDVVAKLAERARIAEAKLKVEERRRGEPPKPVQLRIAELPTLTRFVFEPTAGTPIQAKEGSGEIELTFDGPTALDTAGEKPKLASGVKAFEVAPGEKSLSVKVAALPGFEANGFQEDGTYVVDLARPAPAAPPLVPEQPKPEAPARADAGAAPQAGSAATGQAVTIPDPPRAPAAVVEAAPEPAPPPSPPALPPPPPGPPGVVRPRVEANAESVSIAFPFRSRTPAAGFESAGRLTLVFDTQDRIEPVALPREAERVVRFESAGQEDGMAVVRLAPQDTRPMRLAQEGEGWRLILGGRDALPPDPLRVTRSVDEIGGGIVSVPLPNLGTARWMRDGEGGERVAVVTAFGRPQGLPKAMNFVEFGLPATLQGLVVTARADDISVGLAAGGVTISRKAGLSLSAQGRLRGNALGGTIANMLLPRDSWVEDQSGRVFARYNDLLSETIAAPRHQRGEARIRQVRFLLANGMNEEAAGVLAVARGEDAVFARRREPLLLAGIAAVRIGRVADAKPALAAEVLADDPEAVLWRAMLDAKLRNWPQALAGFKRSAEVLEAYADDLAGPLRLAATRAGLETGDLAWAEAQLGLVERMPGDVVARDDLMFARVRLDEAAGRTAEALSGYQRLIELGGSRTWAEATLRFNALGERSGRVPAEDALRQLEVLAMAWHGDQIEIGTTAELARLYGNASRWRDLFNMMRRAARTFPQHEVTRALYDEAAQKFENLFLGKLGETLPAVDALGLYFDFKELAPAGRRGDEIVRRLADRLVELDLLDQAAELLQHQVDKRLTGAARSTVATRLAAVRLMNGKPAQALAALHGTRLAGLPEEVRQFRVLLEAQALADLTRVDLALETIDGEVGPEFGRLRTNILWGAKRWREAGESAEALVGLRWQAPEPLSDRDRADIIRAAVAYGMADEALEMGRLRSKFGAKMADSPEAATFDMLLRPGAMQTREFRQVALGLSKADALKELLSDWKGRHPDSGDAAALPTPPAAKAGGAAKAADARPGRPRG
jgi:hypothetical protein